MLKIYKEAYDINDLTTWSGATNTVNTIILKEKSNELFALLEELFPEGATETQINDLLWFDDDYIFECLGINEENEEDD